MQTNASHKEYNRLNHLDFLKGLAIFLVVMGHFLAWTFPSNVDRGYYPLFVKHVIYTFHMPLFFFVSGYLVDLKKKEWSLKTGMQLIWKRFRSLLIPGGGFFVLLWMRTGTLYFEWFLKVLFEMYLVFVLIRVLSHYLMKKTAMEIALHLVMIVVLFIVKSNIRGTLFSDVTVFSSFCDFYPYFFLGYICCKFQLNEYVMSKNWIYSFCLVAWCILFFMPRNIHFPGSGYVAAMSAIVVCWKLAQGVNFKENSFVVRNLLLWGKGSLAIYLLSPMIIPSFPELGILFINSDAYEPFGNMTKSIHVTTIFLQMVTGVVISIYVCVVCTFLRKIIQKSKCLSAVLLGETLK